MHTILDDKKTPHDLVGHSLLILSNYSYNTPLVEYNETKYKYCFKLCVWTWLFTVDFIYLVMAEPDLRVGDTGARWGRHFIVIGSTCSCVLSTECRHRYMYIVMTYRYVKYNEGVDKLRVHQGTFKRLNRTW